MPVLNLIGDVADPRLVHLHAEHGDLRPHDKLLVLRLRVILQVPVPRGGREGLRKHVHVAVYVMDTVLP